MRRFIAAGDNCVDYYENLGKGMAGGCSLNFSVYVRQLGAESAYLGAVGRDDYAGVIVDALTAQGVEHTHLKVLPGTTAVTTVHLEGTERKFLSYNEGVLKDFSLSRSDIAYIRGFDYFHSSVYGNVGESMLELKPHMLTIYDFAGKFEQQRFVDLLPGIHFAFLSYERDDAYIRGVLRDFVENGALCAVATLGADGSVAYDGGDFVRQAGGDVPVVDTLGAGDSFIAGFMYAVSCGVGTEKCLKEGARKAEETIGRFGAF